MPRNYIGDPVNARTVKFLVQGAPRIVALCMRRVRKNSKISCEQRAVHAVADACSLTNTHRAHAR